MRDKGLFINYVTQSWGGGVNPCVTLWSDGSVKWSLWRYSGGRGSILGQNGVTQLMNDPQNELMDDENKNAWI